MTKRHRQPRELSRHVRLELDEHGGGEVYILEGVARLTLNDLDPRPAGQAAAERMLALLAGMLVRDVGLRREWVRRLTAQSWGGGL